MTLSDKEKMIAVISNGIAVFSLLQERDSLPPNTTMYDFVLKNSSRKHQIRTEYRSYRRGISVCFISAQCPITIMSSKLDDGNS